MRILAVLILATVACHDASGPESLVGATYRLVSINGRSLPAYYYQSADHTYSVGADSARITVLSPTQIRRAIYFYQTNLGSPDPARYVSDYVYGLELKGDSIRLLGISDPDRGTISSDEIVLALTVFDVYTSTWRYVRER